MSTAHASPHTVPKTLDAWVRHLDGVALPVPVANHDRVRAALNDSRRSLREIAEMMQESPALVLSVMREANHQNHGTTEQAESLEVAINRLGLARTETLLGRLPAKPVEEIPAAFRQLILVSQHATQQANGLFASRLARLWQDIHLGSLLFLAPLWPLALAYPKLLEELELRVIHKGHSSIVVEKELFGVNLLELCLALAEFWRLPVWVTRGYKLLLNERRDLVKALRISREDHSPLQQQQLMDADPNMQRWLNQPANTVLLGNGLALAAQHAWNSPHCLRWERLTSLYLQQSLDDVQQQAHQNAASSARIHNEKDLWHPAEALLWPWDARRVRRDNDPAPPPSADALQLWRKQCAELLQEPSPFINAIHLTTAARDAFSACGMQRVMLLMVDKTSTVMRVHQSAGLPPEAAALQLFIKESTVLQRLLAQPTQLRMTPVNNAQFAALLPAPLKTLFSGQHWLIRSLSSNNKVMMLVVADQGGGPLSEISVQAFGKTAQCIERALGIFSHRKA
ncbi:HDOD domain-containing protein [Pseudomonas sp. CDFA 602]|uniref:HDOD domain-containing protein n=1 Tax=Pseudomonas californiensis TaxID=2829823 RepID=UPI001E647B8B|nr:HDOD domain-containing protein [Pseudomonas californiensis]MCD5994430.1 HDOD domain-containing protein [Pseudomonas californiensis]MCD5999862.1 HDOD domain-containing protein [Pseudomonas californiensis]